MREPSLEAAADAYINQEMASGTKCCWALRQGYIAGHASRDKEVAEMSKLVKQLAEDNLELLTGDPEVDRDVFDLAQVAIQMHNENIERIKQLELQSADEKQKNRLVSDRVQRTFKRAWSKKVAEGYQYGPDALEHVEFGWEIAHDEVVFPARRIIELTLEELRRQEKNPTESAYYMLGWVQGQLKNYLMSTPPELPK